MMRTRSAIVALFVVFVWAGAARAADFVVIVHPSNPVSVMTRKEASDDFLKKNQTWQHGTPIEAVDLEVKSLARSAFSLAIHKRPTSAVLSYWQHKIFSGRDTPPPTRASDAAVIAFVSSRPGAIGYVAPASVTEKVKVVSIDSR